MVFYIFNKNIELAVT